MGMFREATRKRQHLRMALLGPAGSGKTYTAMRLAKGMGGRVAVIDSEHSSASLYADQFKFASVELMNFSPKKYVEAMRNAVAEGFNIVIIDSLSHAWAGKGGVLEFVDNAKRRGTKALQPWGEVRPMELELIETMLGLKAHLIVTMRTRMGHVQDEVEEGGKKKTVVRKVGMQPIQRDGIEYEFDIVGDMTDANELIISKTRASWLSDDEFKVIQKPGEELGKRIGEWLNVGVEVKAEEKEALASRGYATAPVKLDADGVRAELARLCANHFEGSRDAMFKAVGIDAPKTLSGAREALAAVRTHVAKQDEVWSDDPPDDAGPPAHDVPTEERAKETGQVAKPAPPQTQNRTPDGKTTGNGHGKNGQAGDRNTPATVSPTEFWKRLKAAGVTEKDVEQDLLDHEELFGVTSAGQLSAEQRATYLGMVLDREGVAQ